jgi:hypothetical protein
MASQPWFFGSLLMNYGASHLKKWPTMGRLCIDVGADGARNNNFEVGWEGQNLHFRKQPGQLSPAQIRVLFWRQRDSKKGGSCAFFGGVVPITFSFFKFFYLRGISVGAFSEFKMPKPGGQVRRCPKPGIL